MTIAYKQKQNYQLPTQINYMCKRFPKVAKQNLKSMKTKGCSYYVFTYLKHLGSNKEKKLIKA